jgi:hypothetical protein
MLMGFPVTSVDPCRIVTNKTVKKEIVGSRVWLITGEGKPRTFFLRSCFVVDQVVSGTEHGFKTKLLGKHCRTFDPMVGLSNQDWFDDLKRTQSNFNFGLQVIRDHNFVLGFERVGR